MHSYQRHAARLILVGMVMAITTGSSAAQSATPQSTDTVWLFSLNFRAADLVVADLTTGQGTLTLRGVDTEVLAFTDRPQRRAAVVSLEAFIDVLNASTNDPPNALVAIALTQGQASFEAVLALGSASSSQEPGSVTIKIQLIDQQAGGTPTPVTAGRQELAAGYLLVDGLQVPVRVPVNVCGNTEEEIGLLKPAVGNQCVSTDSRKQFAVRSPTDVAPDSPDPPSDLGVSLPHPLARR